MILSGARRGLRTRHGPMYVYIYIYIHIYIERERESGEREREREGFPSLGYARLA